VNACPSGALALVDGVTNFPVREAVIGALDTESALNETALATIGQVKAGALDLNAALDDLTGQSRVLLDEIVAINAPGAASDSDLKQAQEHSEAFLRNRVHQLERSFSARTPEELEALYTADAPELASDRQEIENLLIRYGPELEEVLR